jgi:hypothetical protein
MQDVRTIPATMLDGMVGSQEPRLHSSDGAGKGSGSATAHHPNTPRSGWHVKARDLHPGDVVQQYDWPLHVREVTLSQDKVAIVVTEFEFPLRYTADAQVLLVA